MPPAKLFWGQHDVFQTLTSYLNQRLSGSQLSSGARIGVLATQEALGVIGDVVDLAHFLLSTLGLKMDRFTTDDFLVGRHNRILLASIEHVDTRAKPQEKLKMPMEPTFFLSLAVLRCTDLGDHLSDLTS